MSDASQLTGEVEKLLPGGEALVHSETSTYLVANAIPGDTISFEPTERRRGAKRALLTSVLKCSSMRVEAPCPVADQCGGCALQYLDPDMHGETKSLWVLDIFKAFMNPESLWIPAEGMDNRMRRRVRWFVGSSDRGLFLGFRSRASHTVICHSECMLLGRELNQLRHLIEQAMDNGFLSGLESVQALQLSDGIHAVLEGVEAESQPLEMSSETSDLPIQWWKRNESGAIPLTRPVKPFHDRVSINSERKIDIRIGPDDFVQGQQEGNRQMVDQVIEWGRGSRFIVDLFSGVGNLSLPLAAAHAARVAGAELNPASVQAANANARRLDLDARYQKLNLFEAFDAEPFAGADLLILDPPRRGAKKVCEMVRTLLPAKIVMINCDPASGGRDAATLQSHGYRLHTLRALDLFPYAGHVEAMSLWTR